MADPWDDYERGRRQGERREAVRHLTVSEYRMSRLTALKLCEYMQCAAAVLLHVHHQVLGPEVIAEEGQ